MKRNLGALPAVFPDYVGVTIPVGIAPMNFSMSDDAYTRMDVEVRGSRSGSMHVNGSYADFDIDEWHQLLEANRGGTLSFTVCALKDGQWTRFKTFKMKVSTAPLGEWGVTYRRIAPGYSIYGQMGIYQRDLSTFSEQPLIESSQSPGMCVNRQQRAVCVSRQGRTWGNRHLQRRQRRTAEGPKRPVRRFDGLSLLASRRPLLCILYQQNGTDVPHSQQQAH